MVYWEIYGKYGDLWEICGKYMGNGIADLMVMMIQPMMMIG